MSDAYTWTGADSANSTSWSDRLNWKDATTNTSPAASPPGAGNAATIINPGIAAETISGAGASASLTLEGNNNIAGQLTTGALTISVNPSYYQGALKLLSGASLAAASALINGGNDTTPVTVSLDAAQFKVAGNLEIDNFATFTETSHSLVQAASLTLGTTAGLGWLNLDATSAFEVGAAGGAKGGVLTIDAGAALSDYGVGTDLAVVDNGTYTVESTASVDLGGTLTGTGVFNILAGGFLELGQPLAATSMTFTLGASAAISIGQASAGNTIALSGGDDIELDGIAATVNGVAIQKVTTAATITGFNSSDMILAPGTVTNVVYAAGSTAGTGTLTLFDGVAQTGVLNLTGSFAGATFICLAPLALQGNQTEILILPNKGSAAIDNSADTYVWSAGYAGDWDKTSSWEYLPNPSEPGSAQAATKAPGAGATVEFNNAGSIFQLVSGGGSALSARILAGSSFAFMGAYNFTGALIDEGTLYLAKNATVNTVNLTVSDLATAAGIEVDDAILTVSGVTNYAGQLLADNGGKVVLASGATLGGIISVDATSSIEIGALNDAVGGEFIIDAGANATLDGGYFSAFNHIINGTAFVAGDLDNLTGSLVTGSGVISMNNGGTFTNEVGATMTNSVSVALHGHNTVVLDDNSKAVAGALYDVPTFSSKITGFDDTDTVQLSYNLTNAVYQNGVLDLIEGTRIVGTLNFVGSYASDAFAVSGANVTLKSAAAAAPTVTFTSYSPNGAVATNGEISGSAPVIFSGAVGGSVTSVEVYANGIDLGAATVGGGKWSLTTPLPAGAFTTFLAIASDAAGNLAEASLGTSIKVAISPTITAVQSAASATSVTVAGTINKAASGKVVTIYDGNTSIGAATTLADGSWSLTVTLGSSGAHTFKATVSDAAGNTGTSANYAFLPPSYTASALNSFSSSAADMALIGVDAQGDVFGQQFANGLVSGFVDKNGALTTITATNGIYKMLGVDDAGDAVFSTYVNSQQVIEEYTAGGTYKQLLSPSQSSAFIFHGFDAAGDLFGRYAGPGGVGTEFKDATATGTYTTINFAGLTNVDVVGVDGAGDIFGTSDSGSFILYSGASTPTAFKSTDPNLSQLYVQGVNGAGYVWGTGEYETLGGGLKSVTFVEKGGKFQVLDLPGSTYSNSLTDIAISTVTSSGEIVGTYYATKTQSYGFTEAFGSPSVSTVALSIGGSAVYPTSFVVNTAGQIFALSNSGNAYKVVQVNAATAPFIWNVDAGGDWGTGSDWTPAGPPAPAANVTINTAHLQTIVFGATDSASIDALSVGNDVFAVHGGALAISGGATFGNMLKVTGGTLTFTGAAATAAAFTQTGGAILGSGALTVSGAATLSGGSDFESGAGSTTLLGATNVSGNVALDAGRMLKNKGVLTWTGGAISLGHNPGGATIGGATLKNAVGATFQIEVDGAITAGSGAVSVVNAGLLKKEVATGISNISADFTDTGSIAVMTGTLELAGPVNSVAGAVSGPGELEFGGGVSTLLAGATLTVADVEVAGAGTKLTVDENLDFGGAFGLAAGSSLGVASLSTFNLAGASETIAGAVSGAGKLAIINGAASVASTAAVSVANWAVKGAATTATIIGSHAYGGSFRLNTGANLVLPSGTLSLAGAAAFNVAHVKGSGQLVTSGATSATALIIGGSVEWINKGTVNEIGGDLKIGDGQGGAAILLNQGTYDIADDSGIELGSSNLSNIQNKSLFEKTAGTGVSTIAPAVFNNGSIAVSSGAFDFLGAISGTGTEAINAAGKLKFESSVSAGQTVAFDGPNATLVLGDPQGFAGEVSGFGSAANETLTVTGAWTYLGFSENSAHKQGSLEFQDGAAQAFVTILGDFNPTSFHHAPRVGGGVMVTYG